jgi:DNA end-binding protein Ku
MAPRPQWKGFLKLSFVTCPVALFPAVTPAERVSFRQVNRNTGHRLKQQLVDAVTGEVVDRLDKARGYEVAQDKFVVVEDQELRDAKQDAKAMPFIRPQADDAAQRQATHSSRSRSAKDDVIDAPPLAPAETPAARPRVENTHTIEIERFVALHQIDARYHEKPYYIVPHGPIAGEAFAVIREAMAGKEVAGLGHVILLSRERPIAIQPLGLGLQGMTLRYPYEVRSEAEYFAEIAPLKLPPEMLDLARHIVGTMQADFNPAMLNDRERAAVVGLLKEKQRAAGISETRRSAPSPENVVNLMDALKRSLAATKSQSGKPAKTSADRRRKPARARS